MGKRPEYVCNYRHESGSLPRSCRHSNSSRFQSPADLQSAAQGATCRFTPGRRSDPYQRTIEDGNPNPLRGGPLRQDGIPGAARKTMIGWLDVPPASGSIGRTDQAGTTTAGHVGRDCMVLAAHSYPYFQPGQNEIDFSAGSRRACQIFQRRDGPLGGL